MTNAMIKLPLSLLGYQAVGISTHRDCILFRKHTSEEDQVTLLEQYLLSRYLNKVLRDQQINCVFDVGANRGQFARMLRNCGYKGHILSFEPLPDLNQKLEQDSKSDPLWKVFPFALGSKNEQTSLNLTNANVLTSFLTPSEYGKHSMQGGATIYNTVNVDVKRLDTVFDEVTKGIESPRMFLKMDTQGYDLEVLAGAGERIQDFRGLQSEVSIIPLYDGMPDIGESIMRFRQAGFEMVGLIPVVRDKDHAGVIEFDCIMSR